MKDKVVATNIKTKYEYKVIREADGLGIEALQELGQQGWLLCGHITYDYIFARLTDLTQDTEFIEGYKSLSLEDLEGME